MAGLGLLPLEQGETGCSPNSNLFLHCASNASSEGLEPLGTRMGGKERSSTSAECQRAGFIAVPCQVTALSAHGAHRRSTAAMHSMHAVHLYVTLTRITALLCPAGGVASMEGSRSSASAAAPPSPPPEPSALRSGSVGTRSGAPVFGEAAAGDALAPGTPCLGIGSTLE